MLLVLLLSTASASNVGWKSYLQENPTEFHDLLLKWEEKTDSVPSWLSGTYVRNGPAQVTPACETLFTEICPDQLWQ